MKAWRYHEETGAITVALLRGPTPLEVRCGDPGEAMIRLKRDLRHLIARRRQQQAEEAQAAFDAAFRYCLASEHVSDECPQRGRLHDRTLVRYNGNECAFCERTRKRADYQRRKLQQNGTVHQIHAIALDELADLMAEAA